MANDRFIFAFDGTNPQAQETARRFAARHVREVTDETKAAIRKLVRRGIAEGLPPREIARDIRTMIGLTRRQMGSALNFRQALIDEGLPVSVVDRRMATYIDRRIRQRALLIANHETIAALDAGIDAGWKQAREEGFLRGDEGQRWFTNDDPSNPLRPCPICEPMDGQVVGLDEQFTTGDGDSVDGPPAHVRCRCGRRLISRRELAETRQAQAQERVA